MGRRKTYDREQVLRRAMELFWKAGFEGAHLSKLVEVTGLNRFSLYKEFGGKEGLFEEALEYYLESARKVYQDHLGRKPLGLDNIRSYFASMYYSPDYHGCFMINTLAEKYVVSDKSFKAAKKFTKYSERLYLKNLEAAKANGALPAETDPKILAKLLLTVDQGLAIYGIAQPSNSDQSQIASIVLERILGLEIDA